MLAPLLALALTGAPNSGLADLQRAKREIDDLGWFKAERSLARARAAHGNDLQTTLEIFRLTGVVEAAVGKKSRAVEAFEQLLLLSPSEKISDDYGPKIATAFFEARAWLDKHQPLRFEALPAKTAPGKVLGLAASVKGDPAIGARAVRFHVGEKTLEAPVKDAEAAVELDAGQDVTYWAELLGENESVIGQLGSANQPLAAHAPPPASEPKPEVAAVPKPEPKPTVTAEPSAPAAGGLTASQSAPEPPPRLRPLAYGLMGGGVAALALGTYFGVQSHSAQSQLDNASTDPQGHVVGITRAQALSLHDTAHTDGLVADGLWAAGLAAAGAGVGLWFWGAHATVVPQPGGAAIEGEMP